MLMRIFMEPEILTERLLLRRPTVSDITEEYIQWMNNPDVNRFLEVRHRRHTRESCAAYVKMRRENSQLGLHFGVFANHGKLFIGTVTFNGFHALYKTADISFVIGHPQAQRKGYATEAVAGACRFAFREQGLFKVTGGHYANNIESLRVFQKNGFHIEGILRAQHVNAEGVRGDSIVHGLLATEFESFHSQQA